MKKRLCALMLALCFTLCGCGSLFHRSYASVEPFTLYSTAEQDPSILAAENYQELLSALLHFVIQHVPSGTVRLYNYSGEDLANSDLTRACQEIVQKDPLVAFCVNEIRYDMERIVSYYEVRFDFYYRRTAEEVDQILPVTGNSAIKTQLRQALFTMNSQLLLRINYFSENTDLNALFAQAYYDTPLSAYGFPELSLQCYPETGLQRIVEINFLYPEDPGQLQEKQEALIQAVTALLPNGTPLPPEQLYALLMENTGYSDAPDLNSAYAALVEGAANDEGLALAYKLLCDRLGLTCCVVRGQHADGTPRFWNIVSTSSGSRHVDCSAGLYGLTDLQMAALEEYVWSGTYPICRDGNEFSLDS